MPAPCSRTTSGRSRVSGFPPVPASGVYGLTMAINLGGMFLSGYLTDRVNRPLLLGTIYIVRSVSFIVLMFVGTSYEMLLLFAVIYGVFDYSTVPPTASLVASHLGLRIMGLAMGLIVWCMAWAGRRVPTTGGLYAYVGVALGPYAGFLSGVLLWMTGTFAFAAVATIFTAASPTFRLIRKGVRKTSPSNRRTQRQI